MTMKSNAITALGLGGGIWVILSAASDIAERARLFRVSPRDSFRRLRNIPRAGFGAALGHAGFGVMVLGIAGMTLASQKVVVLNAGQSTQLGGYTWTLDGLHDAPGPNYAQRIADVTVSDDGKPFLTLHPSRRVFVNPKGVVTNDASIHTNGFQDIYVVFANETSPGNAELRLNRHPLAPEIWFGGLIMALGGALSLSDRRLRVGAPARKRAAKPQGAAA